MPEPRATVVIGGTSGLGREVARHYAAEGDVVVISGRDEQRAQSIAMEIGDNVRGIGVDLSRPEELAARLSSVDRVDQLVIAAIERDHNNVRDFDVARATRLVILKLVGYAEVVHTLLPRMGPDTSIVMFGGGAFSQPYPGSTTVSTVNGGVIGLVRTLAVEIAPIRVNAIHPGIVWDSPQWIDKPEVHERVRSLTPGRRIAGVADIIDAVAFLLRNPSVNGVDLPADVGRQLL
jgi:NAD(P)-dependent dehydrogenase (short-subunit alcohol dehydrogenase family)